MRRLRIKFANLISGNIILKIYTFIFLLEKITCIKPQVPFFLKNSLCISEECEFLGSAIENSLNKSVQPCDNFYEFSCGGWVSSTVKPDYEPVWNHWQALSYKMNNRIEKLLENVGKEDNIFRKIKVFYNSCMKTRTREDEYLKNLKELIEEFGGWPISKGDWQYKEYDVFEMIAKITRLLGIHPILNINVNTDYKSTRNQIIYIQPGDPILPEYILANPSDYKFEIRAYKAWIYETVRYLYPSQPKAAIKLDIKRLVNLEVALTKLNQGSRNERISIEKLSFITKTDWKNILQTLFQKTNTEMKPSNLIIIKNRSYLKSVMGLVKTDSRTIVNYLLWHMVKDLSRETTQYMRNLNSAINQAILGTKADLPRRDECFSKVKTYFSYAIAPKYTELFVHSNTMKQVEEIINHVKIQFIKVLEANSWMSDQTKSLSIEKIENVNYFIGYPNYISNESYAEDYFKDLNISEHHFFNMLRLKRFFSEQNLKQLDEADIIRWPSNTFEVNAYYSILQNAIFIPLGLLDLPFFHPNRPLALNYGAFGSLVGHEITHALDHTGRNADKNGNIKKWWAEEDIKKYEDNTQCYENYYNKFNVDGYLTTGENMADNFGLKLSYLAFKSVEPQQNSHSSQEQLFFISFAQMWCEIPTKTDIFSLDEHAPTEKRVLGTLTNSEYFTRAFKCKNFENQTKCSIW